ncbi:MAG: methyltransferase domain-containing protein [Actinobacteria bacterium]|nr:methyltransferase domain-containing protein [Actinomycetota bacterium]
MTELSGVKSQQRQMWTLGDYAAFGTRLQPAADALVSRIGVRAGQDVLDVATGTGNAAITAATAGARVTGLDLSPELLAVARGRAADGGWPIEWIEGDAEHLPYADQSFDRVMSVFGAMFAPDHRRTAEELVRVCRPGGAVGVCSWTPPGVFGQMIILLISRTPAPPPDFKPPGLWGVDAYVKGLFDGLEVELEFERADVIFEHESAEAWVAELDRVFGPTILAKAALEPTGDWDALRADLVDLFARNNELTDGAMLVRCEYLTTIARRSSPAD